MNNKVIINILRFIGLVLLQILVIDNIRFGRYIHPYVYVLFVMLLPTKMSDSLVMTIGFLTGLVIDIFAGTPGLNAAATTFMTFVRPLVINSMFVGDDIKNIGEPLKHTWPLCKQFNNGMHALRTIVRSVATLTARMTKTDIQMIPRKRPIHEGLNLLDAILQSIDNKL